MHPAEDEAKSLSSEPIIVEIRNLKVYFQSRQNLVGRKNTVRAVDDVSLTLEAGEALSLVGESGSGKSTLARTIVKLNEPTAGTVLFHGRDIFKQSKDAMKEFRRRVQMIFQDPYESLYPQTSVFGFIVEPMLIHRLVPKEDAERERRVSELLTMVGLDPLTKMNRFPHELSGGERQRVAIARALSLKPEVLIADEPVSMLDVSIRLGILNLMLTLKHEFNLTYLFITHDVGVAKYIGTRIAVMYFGKIVEIAESDELINHPLHHYTNLLLSSIPGSETAQPVLATRDPDYTINATDPPSGCRFHPRCPSSQEKCRHEEPRLIEMRKGHFVACHYPLGN